MRHFLWSGPISQKEVFRKKESQDGRQQAERIYGTDTQASLTKVQTLLGKVTGLAKENILSEDQVIQSNSAAAEEMASTSEELTAQAAQMQETIAFFKTETAGAEAKPRPQGRALSLPGAKAKKGAAPSAKGVTLALAAGKEEDFERY